MPRSADPERGIRFFVLIALLLFAPLIWAGTHPLARLILELGALALAACALRHPRFLSHLDWPWLGAIGALLLLPLVQLIPVPMTLWQQLPGRAFYSEALSLAGVHDDGWRAISLIPTATEAAWLALLPPVMVFIVAVGLPTERLRQLAWLVVMVALLQALLGLLQFGDGPQSVFRFGNTHMGNSAHGTYVNRNHLAGLLAMTLPMVLGIALGYLGRTNNTPNRRWQFLAQEGGQRAVVCLLIALVLILGLVFTRSRAGLIVGMVGLFLTTLLFAYRLGSRQVYGWLGGMILLALGLAVQIGLAPIVERFAAEDPLENSRWITFSHTLQAIGEFFPLGSGAGTFPEIFRRFQPEGLTGFVNRAHNDYLEWSLGMGLPMMALLLGFGVLYLRQWYRLWTPTTWGRFRCLQAGAGIGLLVLALHCLVDFNFHIPANAIYFALLAAIFCHQYRESAPRRRRTSRLVTPLPPSPAANTPISNPFAE